MSIANYKIQDWLFSEAEGRFEIDLAESGIQFHSLHDLSVTENFHLNYSLDAGDSILREKLAKMYGVRLTKVMITTGSQEALYLFYRSFLKSGDHVLTFSPGWQQSWEVPKIMGADVTVVNLRDYGYELTLDVIQKYVQPNTKLLILNSPHNPTGWSYSSSLRDDIKLFCGTREIFVLNDEEYLIDQSMSITQGSYPSYAGCVTSLSKVFGFPGLRMGWFVGPELIVRKMINYRRYTSVCNSHLCERLAEQVLDNYQKYVDRYLNMTRVGYEILEDWVAKYPELSILPPEGTPFAYVYFKNKQDTQVFAREILEKYQVLIMPAEVFEDHSAFRISFGRERPILEEGLKRIGLHLKECYKK